MGRSITFYAISANMEHDKTKICFDFEFEPEDCWEYKQKYWSLINPDTKEIVREDYQNNSDYIIDFSNRIKEKDRLWGSHEHNKLWCPKCKLFKSGIWGCDYIIDRFDVQHSYSNPIWFSEWNIKDCYLGSHQTNFIQRFSKESQLLREISKDDINYEYKRMEELGEPIRTSDLEAKEETMEVLDFLKKYAKRTDVILVVADEY